MRERDEAWIARLNAAEDELVAAARRFIEVYDDPDCAEWAKLARARGRLLRAAQAVAALVEEAA